MNKNIHRSYAISIFVLNLFLASTTVCGQVKTYSFNKVPDFNHNLYEVAFSPGEHYIRLSFNNLETSDSKLEYINLTNGKKLNELLPKVDFKKIGGFSDAFATGEYPEKGEQFALNSDIASNGNIYRLIKEKDGKKLMKDTLSIIRFIHESWFDKQKPKLLCSYSYHFSPKGKYLVVCHSWGRATHRQYRVYVFGCDTGRLLFGL